MGSEAAAAALSPVLTGTRAPQEFPVHDLMLGRDGLIVENLTGLPRLSAGVHDVGIFPMPSAGVDGAPARVVVFGSD